MKFEIFELVQYDLLGVGLVVGVKPGSDTTGETAYAVRFSDTQLLVLTESFLHPVEAA